MKKRNHNIRVLISVVLILALGISMVNIGRLEAASRRLAKPKISVKTRAKKSATIKIKGGNVTGYRIDIKIGKKGKWKMNPVMCGMKNIKGKQATFSLTSKTLKLTKLKPNKVYYIKIRAWKSSWKSRKIKLSPYSKVLKIGKYNPKAPAPTDANVSTGDAVQVPEKSPSPSAEATEVPGAEQTESPDIGPSATPSAKPTGL